MEIARKKYFFADALDGGKLQKDRAGVFGGTGEAEGVDIFGRTGVVDFHGRLREQGATKQHDYATRKRKADPHDYNNSRVPVAPIPAPFDQLRSSPFSFYPPIVNVEHNEWTFRRATWTEVEVMNTKTSEQIWIPRHFVGELSLVAEPVILVGLVKELEYREGAVYPHVRRVIEMPRAVNGSPRTRAPQPAAVVGIRVESPRRGRNMLATFAAGILACLAVVTVFRDGVVTSRLLRSTHVDLPFTAADDYDSVVARLGPPGGDEWRSAGDVRYRRLWYPREGFAVILVGGSHPHYGGAVDSGGRVLHAVRSLQNLR